MNTEKFSTAEKVEAMKTYGSSSDEVCYAARRLRKIGAVPYTGDRSDPQKDVLARAIMQAKENNQMVSVYLGQGEGNGLFLITPGYFDARFIDGYWPVFAQDASKDRWDKPIAEQKKVEEFDRFSNYEYSVNLFNKWDVLTLEGLYAAERMEKSGIEPYEKRLHGADNQYIAFKEAAKQAKEKNNSVGLKISFGPIHGLFAIAPDKRADDDEFIKELFDHYVKNQQKLRWDKPLEQQKAEEKMLSSKQNVKE